MNNKIYLVHADANRKNVLKKVLNQEGPIQWLYLGRNYIKLMQWQKCLGFKFKHIQYSELLHNIAIQWRQPYIDWISQLGKLYNGLSWWSSSIAQKHTAGYSLYHNICYLHIALLTGREIKSPLLIIGESKFLLRRIASEHSLQKRIKWIYKPYFISIYTFAILKMIFVWIRYLVRGYFEIVDAKKTKEGFEGFPLFSDKVRILIHSCIEDTYFGEDGTPNDRYFTILPIELQKRGFDIVTLPWLFNIKRTRQEAFKWFREHPGEYLIPADYYNILDYLWSAWIIIQQIWIPRGKQIFEGMDITLLVSEERLRQASSHSAAMFVLYYRLIKRWKQIGLKLNIFIDTFENMFSEKPQVMAFRKYMPDVVTVGYQHYIAPYDLWFCMYTTAEESTLAPHPDVIVCNSKFMKDLFSRHGFPESKLVIGPSLRYLPLTKNINHINDKIEDNKKILVILTIDPFVVSETLTKLIEAFPDNEGVTFLIKVHPMMSKSVWLSILQDVTLPKHMNVVYDEMVVLIPKIACSIIMFSTASLELLLYGVPVILLGRETDFDMNPLAWFFDLEKPVHTSKELRENVLRIISEPDESRKKIQLFSKSYRKLLLSPINDDTINSFVKHERL